MSDPIDVALADIDANLSKCAVSTESLRTAAIQLNHGAFTYAGNFRTPGEALWEVFGLGRSLTDIIASMTFDAQMTVTDAYLAKQFSGQQIKTIEWVVGDIKIEAVPVGDLAILTSPLNSGEVRPGHLVMSTHWDVSIDNAPPQRRESWLEFRIDMKSAWPSMRLVPARALIFTDSTGEVSDPIKLIPYGKSMRFDARRELARQVTALASELRIPIPSLSSLPLPLSLRPLTSFARGALHFAFKIDGISRRRAPYIISQRRLPEPYDVFIRLKVELITQQLASIVGEIEGASLQEPRFAGGNFWFTVAISRTEHKCIAEARINAWIDYQASVISRGNNRLMFEANQRSWRASWEIDWCFHKCDEASDEIRKTLKEQINLYKKKSVTLGDFSQVARQSYGWMDPFGVNIQMESKS